MEFHKNSYIYSVCLLFPIFVIDPAPLKRILKKFANLISSKSGTLSLLSNTLSPQTPRTVDIFKEIDLHNKFSKSGKF